MQEVEVKILDVDTEAVIKKLEELGAKKVFEGDQEINFFDFPDKSLDKKDSFVRIRKEGEEMVLTYKGAAKYAETKSRPEYEVTVSEYEDMKKILEGIGLEESPTYSKHRISYKLGNVGFELDTIPEIPTYLEIEAQDIDTIKEYVAKLGYTMKDAKPWNFDDIKNHYGKK